MRPGSDAALQPLTPDTRHLTPRRGLTLVELLITILIIGILAAAVLGVAAVASQSARESRTRIMIARIHTLVNEQHDTYKSRRVKVRDKVLEWANGLTNPTDRNKAKALARLYATRELMLTEIPQQWSDILLVGLPASDSATMPTNYEVRHPHYLQAPGTPRRTELAKVYLRHFDRIAKATNKFTNELNTVGQIRSNQGAECLYLFVMNACGDGEARSLFPESMLGDTDGDGALEFLDGWGRPIEFLRWVPGFNSEIQISANQLDERPEDINTNNSQKWQEAAARDHDPFDVQRMEIAAFRLVPLICSPGADGDFGIVGSEVMVWTGITTANLTSNVTGLLPRLSPFIRPTSSISEYAGTATDRAAAVDNIHNHLISMKPRR